MSRLALVLFCALGAAVPSGAQEGDMGGEAFFVVEHQGGSLAVSLASVVSVFRAAPEGDTAPPVRLNLSGGSHPSFEGEAAATLWTTLSQREHADRFVWVSHMGGRLGIAIASIESVFRTDSGDAVRINYAGDPQGKTVQGPEAEAVWERVRR